MTGIFSKAFVNIFAVRLLISGVEISPIDDIKFLIKNTVIPQKKKKIQDGECGEEGANGEDTRVAVIETATGRTLTGDDAPLMSQLTAFLETHPGWEPVDSDSEEDDEDEEDENEEKDDKDEKDEKASGKLSDLN